MKKILIGLLFLSSISNAYVSADEGFTVTENPEVVIPIIAGTATLAIATMITLTLSMLPIAPEVFGATATTVVAGTLIGSEVASVVGGIAVLTGVTTGAGEQIIHVIEE